VPWWRMKREESLLEAEKPIEAMKMVKQLNHA
jgi:hypothetical protein